MGESVQLGIPFEGGPAGVLSRWGDSLHQPQSILPDCLPVTVRHWFSAQLAGRRTVESQLGQVCAVLHTLRMLPGL